MRTVSGFDLVVEHGLDRLATADLIALPAIRRDVEVPPALVDGAAARRPRAAPGS